MRTKYISGLDEEELDELVVLIEELLPESWNKPTGRPKKLSLRDAIALTSAYKRQNIIQDVLAEIWDISQGIVSEIIVSDDNRRHHTTDRAGDSRVCPDR